MNILDHPDVYIEKGWEQLVLETHAKLVAVCPDYGIGQIKEKWGGLRYYIDIPEGVGVEKLVKMYDIIDQAEGHSYHVCEQCGDSGELRQLSCLWKTLCTPCHKELKQGYNRNSEGTRDPF